MTFTQACCCYCFLIYNTLCFINVFVSKIIFFHKHVCMYMHLFLSTLYTYFLWLAHESRREMAERRFCVWVCVLMTCFRMFHTSFPALSFEMCSLTFFFLFFFLWNWLLSVQISCGKYFCICLPYVVVIPNRFMIYCNWLLIVIFWRICSRYSR